MKISLNWLKDYVSFKLTKDELVYRLTMLGLEVEKVHQVKNDTLFELEITPNRPDCLNIIGIAREISAGLNIPLQEPILKKNIKVTNKSLVNIQDKLGCRRYVGIHIENVQIEPSANLIKNRLTALGSRLINNVVDITNFCLMEMGQPLHAFDYDKLAGGKIIVRRAQKGEKIVTLDGVTRELDEHILIIADSKKPVAIAGIMGGKETEVTHETKNVFLESAWFDPILIRRASRRLGLSSDSSYRFERRVDIQGVEKGALRASNLISTLAKGKMTAFSDVCFEKNKKAPVINFSMDDVNAYLGSNIKAGQCRNIFTKLGCKVATTKNGFKVAPPSFRHDLQSSVDLVEEISRVIGFDQLPESLPQIKITSAVSSPRYTFKNTLRKDLAALGLSEIVTYTMYNRRVLEKSNLSHLSGTKIKNPLSSDQEIMRPSLFPSMLDIVLSNFNKGQKNLKLYELGKNYCEGKEKEFISILMTGVRSIDWRLEKKAEIGFFDIKGVVEGLMQKLNGQEISVKEMENPIFAESESIMLFQDDQVIGVLGRIKEDILQDWDIKSNKVYYGELEVEILHSLYKTKKVFQSIIDFPSVQRDISLAVKEDVKFSRIKDIAKRLGSPILNSITFNEEYLGEKILEGYRGVIFSLNYQSTERTLKEDEVNAVHETISQALINDLQAIKR